MRRFAHPAARSVLLAAVAVAAALALRGQDGMTQQLAHPDLGKDPHAFADAADMYADAPRKPMDADGRAALAEVLRLTGAGRRLEDPAVRRLLARLEPYRAEAEVQEAVAEVAAACVRGIEQKEEEDAIAAAEASSDEEGEEAAAEPAAPPQVFDAGAFAAANLAYEKGAYAEASDGYAELLRATPRHLDARNNLALALMRLRNDLAAQIELEVVLALSPDYPPALINLTVIHERRGGREQARAAATRARAAGEEIPTTAYNLAWLDSFGPDVQDVQARLRAIAVPARPLYRRLYNFNARRAGTPPLSAETGVAPKVGAGKLAADKAAAAKTKVAAGGRSFWSRGVAGLLNPGRKTGGKVLAGIVFFIGTLFLIGISAAGAKGALRRGRAAFWTFVFLGTGFFLFMYGSPFDARFPAYLVYLLFAGGVASSAAK